MTSTVSYRHITTEEDLQLAFSVREEVFVKEQNCPPESEFDHIDRLPDTDHFLAVDSSTGLPLGTIPSLGRLACLKASRGLGVGKGLVLMAHKRLAERGFAKVVIHAQEDKQGFT
ncbi:acyl-CoA N-acyltransferase, partial [Catenaria anguillulae PL171]